MRYFAEILEHHSHSIPFEVKIWLVILWWRRLMMTHLQLLKLIIMLPLVYSQFKQECVRGSSAFSPNLLWYIYPLVFPTGISCPYIPFCSLSLWLPLAAFSHLPTQTCSSWAENIHMYASWVIDWMKKQTMQLEKELYLYDSMTLVLTFKW